MPFRCVAGNCSNVPDASKNIALHKFPDDDDNCPSEKKRRRAWVNFVQTKRAKWCPTKNSRLCSEHFRQEDFDSPFITIPGTSFAHRAILNKDAVPSIHKKSEQPEAESSGASTSTAGTTPRTTGRQHRRVSIACLS